MKYLSLAVGVLVLHDTLLALPVGNPSEASMMSKGVVWSQDASGSDQNWGGFFSIRAGYYGDFVFDRKTQVHQPVSHPGLSETSVYVNAGYLAFNFIDRIDLFGILGAAELCLDSEALTLGSRFGGERINAQTTTALSWGIGTRVTIYEYKRLSLGIEAQYFSTRPDILYISQAATYTAHPPHMGMHYREWQVGLGLSYHIDLVIPVVPYIAIDESSVTIQMDNAKPGGAIDITLYDLESANNLGYALGVSLIDSERVSVTVEGRFANEKAFYANAQLRF